MLYSCFSSFCSISQNLRVFHRIFLVYLEHVLYPILVHTTGIAEMQNVYQTHYFTSHSELSIRISLCVSIYDAWNDLRTAKRGVIISILSKLQSPIIALDIFRLVSLPNKVRIIMNRRSAGWRRLRTRQLGAGAMFSSLMRPIPAIHSN